MELRQLEFFLAVAEEQHFTRAAARVSVSQSALSSSIRSLERELGATLFTRTTRRVTLTPAGVALAVQARRTLVAAAAARAAVLSADGTVSGALRVGGVRAGGRYDIAGLLARYRARHPAVALGFTVGTSIPIIEDVVAARLDAAFVSLHPSRPAALRTREIVAEQVALICRADDPLAHRDSVTLADLTERSFVGAPTWSAAATVLDHIPGGPTITVVANDTEIMLDLVAHGLGVTLQPASFVPPDWGLCAVPISDLDVVWRFGMVSLPDEQLSAAAKAFLDLIDEEIAGGVGKKVAKDA
jgi:DNA-binding transcriptional LysR family regulator